VSIVQDKSIEIRRDISEGSTVILVVDMLKYFCYNTLLLLLEFIVVDRSMCDHILTVNNVAQQPQDYGHLTYAAYGDLLTGMLTGRGQTSVLDGLQGHRTKLSINRPVDCLLSRVRLLLTEFNDEAVTAVTLRAAFDSLSRSLLWLLLTRLRIPDKMVSLLCTVTLSVSAVFSQPNHD